MNVISFVATKSSGKSTSIHVLAERLLSQGVPVHIIDCDPQADQKEFVAAASEHYENLTCTSWDELKGEQHIGTAVVDIVDSMNDKDGVLLIDVQGSDNDLLTLGATISDLVLVPMVDGNLEQKSTATTLGRINFLERTQKRKLPIRIFWAKASGIGISNLAKDLQANAEEGGYKWLGSNLMERREFKNLVLNGKIISGTNNASDLKREERSAEIADFWVSKVGEALV